MDIITNKDAENLTVKLTGRLDTTTAPDLDSKLAEELDGVKELTFDFSELDYISSAGLRSLLSTQKKMNSVQGKMEINGANEMIKEAFEITGFMDILTVN